MEGVLFGLEESRDLSKTNLELKITTQRPLPQSFVAKVKDLIREEILTQLDELNTARKHYMFRGRVLASEDGCFYIKREGKKYKIAYGDFEFSLWGATKQEALEEGLKVLKGTEHLIESKVVRGNPEVDLHIPVKEEPELGAE